MRRIRVLTLRPREGAREDFFRNSRSSSRRVAWLHPAARLDSFATDDQAEHQLSHTTIETMVLTLRARGSPGEVGDARLVYSPAHPEYEKILQHIGDLKPVMDRPVEPWPED